MPRSSLFRSLSLPVFAFAGGMCAQLISGPTADAAPQNESPYFVMGQLGRVLAHIENDYVDPVDRRRLLEGAAKGMLAELDPHSEYYTAKEYALANEGLQGQFAGVGVEVDLRDKAITVIAPIEGSPADRAGIKSGDVIIAVDGELVEGGHVETLMHKMRGAPGTTVKVSIRRDGSREPLTFDLVREIVHLMSVHGKMLDRAIAYLRISQFQSKTHEEMLAAIAKLRVESKGNIAGVILDLRSNGGGFVDEAVEVADEFLASGTIYTSRHRGQIVDDVSAHGGGAFSDVPIVVLVNEGTASASELVGGALQDNRRALIVGVRSFGKGSIQAPIDLPGGDGMKLTIARYYTPGGHAIQADGLHPDVTVAAANAPNGGPFKVREGDREGALPGEGAPRDSDGGVTVLYAGDAGVSDDEIDIKKVPHDPSTGPDPVLKVGYETMRDKLIGKGPLVK